MCGLFLFIPINVMATTNVIQMEHKANVPIDKVWQIKFNQAINEDNLSKSVKVYSPIGEPVQIKISYDSINNTIIVQPPVAGYKGGQTYSLQIKADIKDLNSNPLKAAVTMSFTIAVPDSSPLTNTSNKSYIYNQYDNTLDQSTYIQSKLSPVNVVANYDLKPSSIEVSEYLNPENFENHDYAVYQFLTLNSYTEVITAEELNFFLKGKGVLENQGEAFLAAARENNINVAYLTAHTILETGNGTSKLATGVPVDQVDGNPVESKITFNMFGIKATDDNPSKNGSEYAYKKEWFSVEAAIMGGAEYISTEYINNSTRNQNTLYKMRWNPAIPMNVSYRHQYATDIAWSYKISCKMKQILDKCLNPNLQFEIPQYK
jgi:beta-N-acetylglucosaminidase